MDSTAPAAAAAPSSRRPALPQLNMNVMRLFTTARRPLRARDANTELTSSPVRTKAKSSASTPIRTRQSSISATASPIRVKASSAATSPMKAKGKKAKKSKVHEDELTRKYGRTFASEVALLQFMDGGSTEYNVQRVLKKRAKLAAKQSQFAGLEAGAVSDSQGLFVDAQEREEHQRLLTPREEEISEWEEI